MVDIPERTESHGPVFIYGVEGEQIEEENDAYNDLRYDIGQCIISSHGNMTDNVTNPPTRIYRTSHSGFNTSISDRILNWKPMWCKSVNLIFNFCTRIQNRNRGDVQLLVLQTIHRFSQLRRRPPSPGWNPLVCRRLLRDCENRCSSTNNITHNPHLQCPGLHKDYEADEAEELMPSCFPLLIFDCVFMKLKKCFMPNSIKEEKEEYW